MAFACEHPEGPGLTEGKLIGTALLRIGPPALRKGLGTRRNYPGVAVCEICIEQESRFPPDAFHIAIIGVGDDEMGKPCGQPFLENQVRPISGMGQGLSNLALSGRKH